jgi:hypothetical protein
LLTHRCQQSSWAINWKTAAISFAPPFPSGVVEPADVAALAVHIMTNTTLTGATYDIDGGQQLISH